MDVVLRETMTVNAQGRMIQMRNVKLVRDKEEAEQYNAAIFDLTVDTINVKLSMLHLLQGITKCHSHTDDAALIIRRKGPGARAECQRSAGADGQASD